jgi:O-acetyl-ADP-ribose deacetylase (regulator of RNase III)
MWAMLLAVRRHNERAERRIDVLACPGLGTATGRVPYAEAARQMSLAYRHFLEPPTAIDWRLAGMRQAEIGYGGDLGRDIPPAGS